MIAGINDTTFRFEAHDVNVAIPYGVFTWELIFDWKWLRRSKAENPGPKMVAPVRLVSAIPIWLLWLLVLKLE